MPRINKTEKLAQLTSDYMDAVAELFPKDEQLEKALDGITLSDAEQKALKRLDLDLLSQLVIASIFGYL